MTSPTQPRAIRVVVTLLALSLMAGSLAACNTVAGAGQDVSAAGTAVTGASDATKAKIPSP